MIIKKQLIIIILIVTLFSCVTKPQNSENVKTESNADDEKNDLTGGGEFFKPDSSLWPKN